MKCSRCGGNLELSPDLTAGICASCHAVIPLPRIRPAVPAGAPSEEDAAFALPTPAAVPREGASVSSLLQQGYAALSMQDWHGAAAVFRRVLEKDADCAEAHFGRALARQSCESVDALIRKRKKAGDLVRNTLIACPEDKGRIAAMERKYSIPGYYSPRQVRMLFEGYNRSYLSVTQAWRDRLQEEYVFWDTDIPLNEALRCAKGDLALTIRSARESVLNELQRGLELSEARDQERVRKIWEAYNAHLDRAEREAALRAQSAERSREKDYAEACYILARAGTEEELLDCAGRFSALGAYLDSPERALECREKIRRIVEEQKARDLALELQEKRREMERLAAIRANRRRRHAQVSFLVAAAILIPFLTVAVLFLTPGLLPEPVKAATLQSVRDALASIFSIFQRTPIP